MKPEQHEDRAEQRVQEELDRRVLAAARAPPDRDQEVHRDEHELPEDEEQDEVERDERPGHARRQQQDQREERSRVARLGHPLHRVDDAEERDEERQDEQRQRDAVEADVVPGADRRDPARVDVELHAGAAEVEPHARCRSRRSAGSPVNRPARKKTSWSLRDAPSGTAMITIAPISGRNTAADNPQVSITAHQIPPRMNEHGGEDDESDEEPAAYPCTLPVCILRSAKLSLSVSHADAVDDAVDAVLVDVAASPCRPHRPGRRTVHGRRR